MEVAVVGGGITGLFAARYLRAEGAVVTLFEQTRPGAGSVHAAGILEGHNYYTINNLRYLRRAYRYLANGSSRFRRVDRRWLGQYLRHFGDELRPEDLARTGELGRTSLEEYRRLAEEENDFGFVVGGLEERYDRASLFRDAHRNHEDRSTGERVEVTENGRGGGSLLYPDMGWLDTDRCVQRLVRDLQGVRWERAEVSRIELNGTLSTKGGPHRFDRVVVTAGIACRKMGLPITAVKGYGWKSLGKRPVSRATIFADWGIAAVPLDGVTKVTGGWDFTFAPGPAGAQRLWARARRLMELSAEARVEEGYRPATPDGLPLVGRKGNVAVATGGFRLGWSFGPGLARDAVGLVLDRDREDPFLARFMGSLRAGSLSGGFPTLPVAPPS